MAICPTCGENPCGVYERCNPTLINWGNVPESQIADVCGRDAMKWAEAFCYTAKKIGVDLGDDPEGWMVGWFAAAMAAETANMSPEQHEDEAREQRRVNAFIEQL